MANSIIEDLIDKVHETPGWRYEQKAGTGGYIVYPARNPDIPAEYLRPIHLPRKIAESVGAHSDNYMGALRRAGLPVDQDKPQRAKPEMIVLAKTDSPSPPIDLFEQANARIRTAIDALSDLEGILGKIKADGAEAQRLRDTLRGLMGGK